MREVRLGDICVIKSGGTPSRKDSSYYGGTIPWAKIADIDNAKGGYVNNTEEKLTKLGLEAINNRIFPKETLLFAMYGSIGKVAIAGQDLSTNQAILGIQPKKNSELDVRFLKYWFEKNQFLLLQKARGGVLKLLSATLIRNLKISIPSLIQQKQIVLLLDKVAVIQGKREEMLEKLEELPRSIFFAFFGNVVSNERKWDLDNFGNVSQSRLGKMVDKKKETGKNQHSYLRNANVLWGKFDLTNLHKMDFDEKERKKFALKKGDVLICEGGEVGRAAIWKQEMANCYFQKALHRVRLNESQVLPYFVIYLFWFYSKFGGFQDYVTQATIPHLTGEKLKKLEIPIPPLPLQQKFSQIVTQIESLKSKVQTHLDTANQLFESLIQQAFKGELSINEEVYEALAKTIQNETATQKDTTMETIPPTATPKKKLEKSDFQTITKEALTAKGQMSFDDLKAEIEEQNFETIYEDLKQFIFEALEEGQIQQHFQVVETETSSRPSGNSDDKSHIVFQVLTKQKA